MTRNSSSQSQSDKFKEAAREHSADEDEKRWEEMLKRVAKGKPRGGGGEQQP